MDFLKRFGSAVWEFMVEYAEYRAHCIRQKGITTFY